MSDREYVDRQRAAEKRLLERAAQAPGHQDADDFMPDVRSSIAESFLALDRNRGPSLLWRLWRTGAIEPGELPVVLADVWEGVEWPFVQLSERKWRALWRAAGFVSQAGKPRPTEPVLAYRGAPPSRSCGFSWTTDPDIARFFARRSNLTNSDADERSAVWMANLDPRYLWGLIDGQGGRKESEVVCSPAAARKTIRLHEEV